MSVFVLNIRLFVGRIYFYSKPTVCVCLFSTQNRSKLALDYDDTNFEIRVDAINLATLLCTHFDIAASVSKYRYVTYLL